MSNIQKNNKIFIALIEVKPLDGCQIDPSEYEGAAVRLYVPSLNFFSAIELIKKTIKEDLFKLIEIEMLADDECVDWENPDDDTAIELKKEAIKLNEIVYGEFNGWEKE